MHVTTWMNLKIIQVQKSTYHIILFQQYKSLKKLNIIYGDKNPVNNCPGVNWSEDQENLGG